MTPSTLEAMAREAGLIAPAFANPNPYSAMDQTPMIDRLARFAALVRARALEDAARLVLDLRADGYCADAIRALPPSE